MYRKGDKVLVRMMECTNKKYNYWEVVCKTATVTQPDILVTDKKNLCTVQFTNGEVDHVWSTQFLPLPSEWVDSQNDLC